MTDVEEGKRKGREEEVKQVWKRKISIEKEDKFLGGKNIIGSAIVPGKFQVVGEIVCINIVLESEGKESRKEEE